MSHKIITYLALFSVLFSAVLFLPFLKDHYLIKEIVSYIFISSGLIIFLLKTKTSFTFLKNKIVLFFGIFIIFNLIAGVTSTHYFLVIEKSFYYLLLLMTLILFYELAEPAFLRKFDITLIIVGYIITFYGITQYFGLDFIKWETDYGGRVWSTFGNPNFFSGYLIVLFSYLSFSKIRKSKFVKILLILLLLNIFLSKTKGAILAVSLGLIVSLLIYFKNFLNRKLFFVLNILLFIGFIIITKIFFFNLSNPSVSERFFKWLTAFEMIKNKPFTGVGAGNLKVEFALYQSRVKNYFLVPLKGTSESNVHNDFFQILAETGIFGLTLFLLSFLTYFYTIYKSKNLEFLAPILSFLFFSATNFPLNTSPTAVLTFAIIGISISPVSKKKIQNKIRKLYLLIIFAVLISFFFKNYIPRLICERFRFLGDYYNKIGSQTIAENYYKKAILLDYYHSERTAFDLAEIYKNQNRFKDALKFYKISLNLRNYGEVYNNVGNCYFLMNDYKNALKNWIIATNMGLPNDISQMQTLNNIKILTMRYKTTGEHK